MEPLESPDELPPLESMHDLPPLPAPKRQEQRSQERGGIALVVSAVIALVAATQATSSFEAMPEAVAWTCRGFIYAEALIALGCLFGLMVGDPGVVERSWDTCFPQPQDIAEKLIELQGRPLDGWANVEDGDRSFCVRCLVWRDPREHYPRGCHAAIYRLGKFPKRPHHCSVCQRCLAHFDHHCSVFGRCIGSGNIGYFVGVVAMGAAGSTTCMVSLALGVAHTWDLLETGPLVSIPIGVAVLLCCCRRPICHIMRMLFRYLFKPCWQPCCSQRRMQLPSEPAPEAVGISSTGA
eukprot:gb/GFBE01042626.1/.p1 GENE.gb/GFBE01042626.1/~~gb/GFBE01042626.1/.p1  ORF type:complete len:294 (+),score=37.50 gb/GFBE01042626.1/:1-882(+)